MAGTTHPSAASSPHGRSLSTNSYDTALCIIPPRHLWPAIDRLRELYDKAHGKWPPHLNLIYPFVSVNALERAAEAIQSSLETSRAPGTSYDVRLQSADVFPHRHDNTIFLHDHDQGRTGALQALRRRFIAALGQNAAGGHRHRLHLTVAQSDDLNGSAHKFLLQKVALLPVLGWQVDRLHILVRERSQVDGVASSVMKSWGTVDLRSGTVSKLGQPSVFYERFSDIYTSDVAESSLENDQVPTRSPYFFDDDAGLWKLLGEEAPALGSRTGADSRARSNFTASSYNVLAEFEHPPSQKRYPLLIQNILSEGAAADMLALQEVTDDFLSYLLADPEIRKAYPFASHGPPDQADVEPLPSFLNMVVLSKRAFDWEWLPFARQHKGAVIARLRGEGHDALGKWEDGEFLPLVVASVHLTHGLTDGAVSAKLGELQRVLRLLSDRYEGHPQVLLGDFNIATSRQTIEAALKKGNITAHTAGSLALLESMPADAGMVDAWQHQQHSREAEEDASGDEAAAKHGTTFDPTVNNVAAKMVGDGANNNPQRYDRILIKGEDVLEIARFNQFGRITGGDGSFASDHWGVRCVLTRLGGGGDADSREMLAKIEAETEPMDTVSDEIIKLVVPVEHKEAPSKLADVDSLKVALSAAGAFPTEDEAEGRRAALEILKSVLQDSYPEEESGEKVEGRLPKSPLVFVPVGSYGMGVWTSASDVDLLCIGPFSSTTFFALASQRIRKAAAKPNMPGGTAVKLLRRVRANTGTMLELEVAGVKIDLQYCAATAIAEQWPAALTLPASDPAFALPAQTLGKLKSARDMEYLLRSLPDLEQFRLAHRAVKTWAKLRGIYSGKFGYLCGIHISVLLARVCKLLLCPLSLSPSPSADPERDPKSLSVPDILASFFAHYARFDWRGEIAFDPFFHRKRLPYTRLSREPLAILGYFPPGLNSSHAATVPSVRAIAEEFKRADALLSRPPAEGGGLSWSEFFGGGGMAAADFLRAYRSYVRIELQYWGCSLARGTQYVGWLESRCPALLVDISRRMPGVQARIWPARFVDAAANATGEGGAAEERDYQGCYLIGLEQQPLKQDEGSGALSKGDQRAAAGALHVVLRKFEDLIRGDEKYFDSRCQWMSASVVRRSELGELVPDAREWGEYTPGFDEEDEEDEEDEDITEDDSLDDEDGTSAKEKRHKKVSKNGKKGSRSAVVPRPQGSGAKFRTAADAMNRLRWDPSLDSGDFIVGYEDRFKGAQEKALDAWKTELTDEEFIPQHRILYFKRRSDGVVVWERRTRTDQLFGSG